MAQTYSIELTNIAAQPAVKADATKGYGARLRRYRATITAASQAAADTIVVAILPAGCMFAYGVITASATMGATATIAIGIAGSTNKYRTAAVFTAVDTPTLFGTAALAGAAAPLTADETVIITIAAASLPAAGTLVVDLYCSNG